jgi:hypothetical protein
MSKKIKPEEVQDLTTDQLAEVVEGAIVEILGDELTVLETPLFVEHKEHKEETTPLRDKIFEFKSRGHNHNAIGAMLGIDSELVKDILENTKSK